MTLPGLPAALTGADRTLVMGILNVTPDSFSDGGVHFAASEAVAHGIAMRTRGADIVDIGGAHRGSAPMRSSRGCSRWSRAW